MAAIDGKDDARDEFGLRRREEQHGVGVKDDNRIENLELWVRPQPSGTRASDAIAWAKEILARYEGASGSSNNAQAEMD